MTTSRDAKLREDLAAHEGTRGKRYPKALKARVITFAEQRRSLGHTWEMISTELGICFETVRRWCIDGSRRGRTMKPVKVIDVPPPKTLVVSSRSSMLAVVSPRGLRVEGLTLDDVVMLVRVLG
jgi:hypothetical protein